MADGVPTLADLTTLRLGGPARELVVARTESQLVDAVRSADAAGTPLLRIDRVAFTYGDKPVEWRRGLCVTEGFSYCNELN